MDTASFRRGVRDVAPLLLGIIPFGLVAGIATVNAGLGLPAAVGLSVVVFAGASQLAALELLGQNAPLTVVVRNGSRHQPPASDVLGINRAVLPKFHRPVESDARLRVD